MKFSNIIFSSPQYCERFSAWIEHIPFAYFVIDVLKPKLFVELGTHNGISYFAFCQAINKLKLRSKAYAVDLWTGDEHSGHYGNEVFEYVDEINEQHFSSFSSLLRMSFDDAVDNFGDGSIDLLHIDGLHTYEAVKHDFETWLPKMSSKGVIVFHDTNVYENGFGVWKLLDELRNMYLSMEFPHGYGLGVVCIGKEVNKGFLSFVEKARNNPFVYNLFANLGKKNALKREVGQLISEVDSLNDSLDLCKIEMSKHKTKNMMLTNTILGKDKLLAEKSTIIKNTNTELLISNKNLEIRESTIINLTKSFSWRITKPLRFLKNNNLRRRILLSRNIEKVKLCGLFDEEYYLKNNEDVRLSRDNPLKHFILFGGFEGRKPGPEFDSDYYNNQNPDVVASGLNPLLHYILFGKSEGRRINQETGRTDIG